MCGIFGVIGQDTTKYKSLFKALGIYSQTRGTDATGIAYIKEGDIKIDKAPVEALEFDWMLPSMADIIIGHTRAATGGLASRNFNNHPFPGKANVEFALAHNGILYNTWEFKDLPETKIETDSYITVQLIEKEGRLNLDTLKSVCERLEGSFVFTILDVQGNVYIARHDNPIAMYYNMVDGVYIYASTKNIVYNAMDLLPEFQDYEWLPIDIVEDTIVQINPFTGVYNTKEFTGKKYSYYKKSYDWYKWNYLKSVKSKKKGENVNGTK